MIVSQSALSESFGPSFNGETFEYASALPGAPVVHHEVPVRPPRAYRARTVLAASLRRAAEAVSPSPVVKSHLAR
jgi:hypothetical protein